MTTTPLTPAEIRLAQHADRSTWSTATYDSGNEKALHEIAVGLKAEIDRLRRDLALAIAHDRQPYPTAWAYEQACKAREKHLERAEALAVTLREVLATFAPMRDSVGGLVSYYDGSADIEPVRFERWRAVLDGQAPPSTSLCRACSGVVGWIDCPTGGWWAHEKHPADDHDAQPTRGQHCSAGLMPLNSDPVEPCVVHERHDLHRAASGECWTDADSGVDDEETHVVADDSDDPEHVDDCPGCPPAAVGSV